MPFAAISSPIIRPSGPSIALCACAALRERERHLLHLGDRHHGAEDAAHQRVELDLAGHQHAQRRRIAAGDLAVFGMHRRAARGRRFPR